MTGAHTKPVPEASSTRPSWGRRLVGIEGLRGIAAVSVIVGHVQIHLANGVQLRGGQFVGVLHHGLTLFFALSGFLLFRPFAAAVIAGAPAPPAGRFFRNRALRIYPAYIVIFLLSSYVLRTTYTVSATDSGGVDSVRASLGAITDPWTALADLSMFHTLIPATVKTGLGASWSLTTEITFYLALPLLAALALLVARRGASSRLAVWIVPGVLLLMGFAGKLWAEATLNFDNPQEHFFQQWGSNWHTVLERSLFVHADLFAYGAAAAVVFVLAEKHLLADRHVVVIRALALAVVAVTLACLIGPGLPSYLGTTRWQESAVAAACAAAILVVTLPSRRQQPGIFGRLLETAPLRYTGLISYSLYLWHLPVLWWLATHELTAGRSQLGFIANVLLVVGVTYALSSLTYHFVEAPALRLKKRTDTRTKAPVEPAGGDSEVPARPPAAAPPVGAVPAAPKA